MTIYSIVIMKATGLFFIFLITKSQAECPNSCNCTSTSVLCVEKNLLTVPNLNYLNPEDSPVILDFSGNKLTIIGKEDFSFAGNEEVKEIYLNNSEIVDIGEGTFDNLENLQELYLGQNLLSNGGVPESIIEELDNIILLDMSKNHFDGDMPTIRSDSLEVLAMADSKILRIPENALKYLPNLKLLVLQQNNIKTLAFEPFKKYSPNSFLTKLSFNSYTCSCGNLETFYFLANKKLIETSEPYQCINERNENVNIFNNNGDIEPVIEGCNNNNMDDELGIHSIGFQQVRDMVIEQQQHQTSNPHNMTEFHDKFSENMTDDEAIKSSDLEAAYCWNIFPIPHSKNEFFTLFLLATAISFLIGFCIGALFCKVTNIIGYKKLKQCSDSQVQLLT